LKVILFVRACWMNAESSASGAEKICLLDARVFGNSGALEDALRRKAHESIIRYLKIQNRGLRRSCRLVCFFLRRAGHAAEADARVLGNSGALEGGGENGKRQPSLRLLLKYII
jgi:hypothetical protein